MTRWTRTSRTSPMKAPFYRAAKLIKSFAFSLSLPVLIHQSHKCANCKASGQYIAHRLVHFYWLTTRMFAVVGMEKAIGGCFFAAFAVSSLEPHYRDMYHVVDVRVCVFNAAKSFHWRPYAVFPWDTGCPIFPKGGEMSTAPQIPGP